MAKNRNNKKKNGSGPTAMDVATNDRTVNDVPQAMDTSETGASSSSLGGSLRKIKVGKQMKRSKNVRKMKAIAKAISKAEQVEIKVSKGESKAQRTQSAKKLYD